MIEEKLLVLDCLRAFVHGTAVSSKEKNNLHSLNWDWILRQSQANRILPFMIHIFEREGYLGQLPKNDQIELHSVLMRSAWEHQTKLSEFKKAQALFEKNDVPIIPLKGIALSYLVYQKKPLRLMNDVDLLIPERDLDRSRDILLAEGFVLNEAKNRWHTKVMMDIFGRWDFIQDKMVVDLQWAPKFFVEDEFIMWDCQGAWKRAVPFQEGGKNVWMLSATDQILYLAFQMINDLQINVVYLVQLLDLALIMNKYQINREAVLQETSFYSEPVKNRISDILTIVEDCFFKDKSDEILPPVSTEFLEFFFESSKIPKSGFAINKIVRLIHSPWERFKFIAGYFVPSKNESTSLGVLGTVFCYLNHWKRQFSSLMKVISRL